MLLGAGDGGVRQVGTGIWQVTVSRMCCACWAGLFCGWLCWSMGLRAVLLGAGLRSVLWVMIAGE